MSPQERSPLGLFLEQRRLAMGLERPGQLARRLQPGAADVAISRLGRRIRRLELETPETPPALVGEIALALEIPAAELDEQLRVAAAWWAEWHRARRAAWEKWADEPERPHFVLRLIPGIYVSRPIPDDIVDQAACEAWVATQARERQLRSCLVFNRRLRVWFDKNGKVERRTQATADDPGVPMMRLR